MTTRQITAVAMKFVAIYLWLQAVAALAWIQWVRGVASGPSPAVPVGTTVAVMAVGGIVLAGLGLLAWIRANRFVAVVPPPPPNDLPRPIAPKRLEEIALRVLGVSLAVRCFEPLVRRLISQYVDMEGRAPAWEGSGALLGSAAGLAFGLAFGLLVACRTRAVIDRLDRLVSRKATGGPGGRWGAPPGGARAESDAPPS